MQTRQRLIVLTLGSVRSGSRALRRMASAQACLTPRTTCAAGHERRLRRARNAPLPTWARSSAPLARQFLPPRRARRRVVIIDATTHAEHLRVLTAARRDRGRAIPLARVC